MLSYDNMLSLFPELFDLGWYVPFVFRVFIGIYLLYITSVIFTQKKHNPLTAFFLFLLGMMSLLGIFLQAVGIILALGSLSRIRLKKEHPQIFHEDVAFYILFAIVSLSLVFYGPGPFAFDLPF